MREGGVFMEFLPYYLIIGFIIFIVLGVISYGEWRTACWLALIWPLWVGYLLISLFWGIGKDL